MRKFNIGDRVRILDGSNIDHYCGGWVNSMEKYIGSIYVIREVHEFSTGSNGYYLEDTGGFIYDERGLERVDNHKIVITTDGKTTLARLYANNRVIKSAEAKCSPDDKFDFSTGAKIAFERLTADEKEGTEKRVFFNGRAVYLETEIFKWSRIYDLTKGKIYTFVDGKFTDDNGRRYSLSFERLELKNQGFIEIKE